MLSESVPGWKYTFALPSDCLKVVNVITKDTRSIYDHESQCGYMPEYSENVEITNYEATATELYANHQAVYIRYTAKIENIEKWPAEFTEAFCVRLAIEIALNTRADGNLIKFLEQRYELLIQEAIRSAAINADSGLPKFKDALRHTARQVPYLDYSGIPTRPCSPLDYCGVNCTGKNTIETQNSAYYDRELRQNVSDISAEFCKRGDKPVIAHKS